MFEVSRPAIGEEEGGEAEGEEGRGWWGRKEKSGRTTISMKPIAGREGELIQVLVSIAKQFICISAHMAAYFLLHRYFPLRTSTAYRYYCSTIMT